MVTRVEAWTTDGRPETLVAKLALEENPDGDFGTQHAGLAWWIRHGGLPVPKPYGWAGSHERMRGGYLLMERLPGRTVCQARMTGRGRAVYQRQLADHVAEMHDHTRDTYGDAVVPTGPNRWLDIFRPRLADIFNECKDRLAPRSRQTVSRLLDELETWLPESGRPTLVHGDLWDANILVDDRDPDAPVITGFIDSIPRYADIEYEQAYLCVFHTADRTFFDAYTERHPLREGFERRCRVYWLHTMLIHLWLFGAQYLERCERLTREIEALNRG